MKEKKREEISAVVHEPRGPAKTSACLHHVQTELDTDCKKNGEKLSCDSHVTVIIPPATIAIK